MAAREDLKMRLTRLRGQTARLGRTGLSGPAVLRTAEVGIHLMLAAVLAGAEVFGGFAPFGVAMVGASGTGLCGGAALLGAGFGYLTLLGFSDALRYLSAAILTFAVGFAFYDIKLFQRPWTMPGVAGLMNGCTGFIYLSQGGWRTVDVIYFLSEIALTVAAAWCYRVLLLPIRRGSGEGVCSAARRTGALVLVCTTLISLSNLYLWKDVSFGRTLGACLVLAGAWQGGLAAGAVLGVTIGLSMDLAGSGVPLYAMAWGLAALAAGAFRGKKRVWAAAAFAAADGAAVLWTWDRGLTLAILYEVFLGSVAFFMVPERQWKRLGGLLAPAPTAPPDGRAQGYVQKKLEATAAAFRTLYESLRGSFRAPENDNDVAAVFDRAACRVCRTCSLRSSCWERDYVTTFNALNDATAPMLERGRGVASDYPRYFADRCLHFPAFVEAVNQELTALLYRRQYNSRIRESRAAVCRQYGELSALLGTAAAELSRELIPDPAGNQKLRRHLALLGLEMETAVYRDEYGRLRAELKGEGCQTLDTPEELAALSDLLGVPTRAEAGEESLTLIQLEPLMAVAGVAARKKDGETVSGDAGTYFKREDGTLYVLLCDGMGSGPGAGRESSLAVRLLEQFLMAGVETGHALATLNSALALRGEEEGGFTTVDLLQVDLFTGEGAVYKLGAAPTYVRRGSSVRRIAGSSLPAGLAPSEHAVPDHTRLRLEAGDCVLMVSDGIAGTGDDAWVRERLAKFDGESPKELARSLITDSPEGATDDRTALVVRIARRT